MTELDRCVANPKRLCRVEGPRLCGKCPCRGPHNPSLSTVVRYASERKLAWREVLEEVMAA